MIGNDWDSEDGKGDKPGCLRSTVVLKFSLVVAVLLVSLSIVGVIV